MLKWEEEGWIDRLLVDVRPPKTSLLYVIYDAKNANFGVQ
jgi:hypothetical protein